MITRLSIALLIAASAALVGCGDKREKTIIVKTRDRHVCDINCHDHCYDGGRVVIIKGHRHGPDCGHSWDGAHWVKSKRVVVVRPREHICTARCSHYYRGDRVIELRGHRHGRGCGHVLDGGRWVVRIRR